MEIPVGSLFCMLMVTFEFMLSEGMMSSMMDHSYIGVLPWNDIILEERMCENSGCVIAEQESHNRNVSLQMNARTFQQETQNRYLESFGLSRRRVLGDGNCLFRAISQALLGNEESHSDLRATAVDFIRSNIHMFRDFFHPDDPTVDFDQHMLHEIDQLSKNGVYAGQECVIALSLALGVDILVTHGGTETDPRVFTLQHHSRGENAIILHIVFSDIGGGHYDATTDRDNVGEVTDNVGEINNEDHIIKPSNRKFEWKETSFSSLFSSKTSVSPTGTSGNQIHVSHDQNKFKCSICKKQLSSKAAMKRHTIKYHPDKSVSFKSRTSLNKCMVPSCNEEFRTVQDVLQHLENSHSAIIERSLLTFSSFDEFKSWKLDEELENNVFFKKERKETDSKASTSYQFVCNRNGYKNSKLDKKNISNNNVRKGNIKGSCKINAVCPSRMLVVVNKASGNVKVQYVRTHSHSVNFDQTKHLPVPQNVRDDIAKKLSLGIPVESILDDIHNDIGNLGNRESDDIKFYQLVNRKNIMEMKRKLTDCKYQKHSDDGTSTLLWVEESRNNPSVNPVLVYKPQGVEDLSIPLGKNDFMLVLMTGAQADMYQKFGNRILCMDSTHKTNYYDFKLITLIVVDEYHKGYPVAFCISNREDTTAIQIFLNAVKSKCPETDIGIILTDDDMAGVNAARAVYGPDIQHYLCVWHVHQSWKRKLQTVQNKDHKVEIYFFLHALLNAKTEAEYNDLMRSFTAKYATLEPSFFSYFLDNYASRPEKWALHLRQSDLQTQINTNMFVESFHNKLKTIYFGRKQNKRIDKLIYILMNMEKDYYLNRIKYTTYNKPEDFYNCQISERHTSSLNIPDS